MTIELPPPLHSPTVEETLYYDLRSTCAALEIAIENNDNGFSEKDLKRLDKAITVMKVGFKIMKKALAKSKTQNAALNGEEG
jgi:hypothetical protein